MKRFLSLFLCLLLLVSVLPTAFADETPKGNLLINSTNFPDNKFRNWVKENLADGKDYMTPAEVSEVNYINCADQGIKRLDGIAKFPNIWWIDCSGNELTALDLSSNLNLMEVYCYNNQLKSLNVSKCTKMDYLDCSWNAFTSLDLSKNTALGYLNCSHNALTSLDLSALTNLGHLNCECNELKSLNVSKNTNLMTLYCGDNYNLGSLDVSKNTDLDVLSCNMNNLTKLDVSKNTKLTVLNADGNSLRKLDVSKNTALRELNCCDNILNKLDVSQNPELRELGCYLNNISILDLSNNPELTYLNCGDNWIRKLDLTHNTKLEDLVCYHNHIRYLDVAGCTKLQSIDCSYTEIIVIGGLSTCTALRRLDAAGCNFYELVLDGLPNLTSANVNIDGQTQCFYTEAIWDSSNPYYNTHCFLDVSSFDHPDRIRVYEEGYIYSPSEKRIYFPKGEEPLKYRYDTGRGLMEVEVESPNYLGEITLTDVPYNGSMPYVIYNGQEQYPPFELKKKVSTAAYYYSYWLSDEPGTAELDVYDITGEVYEPYTVYFKVYLGPTEKTSVANNSSGIKISWDAVEGAAGYVIYRRAWNKQSSGWTKFERWNNTTGTTWTDKKVYAGTRYQYGIKAYPKDPMDKYNLGLVGPLKTTVRITTRTLNSVTGGSKQITAKWGASANFTGYQVQIATDSGFTKNLQTVKIANPKTVQTTIKNLKAKTTYYVRVRSYQVFEGTTYYGGWSNVLNANTN